MPQRNLAWLLAVPVLVLAAAVLVATAPAPDRDYQLVGTIVDVLAEVDKNYYRALTPEEKKKLVEYMINGGLHTLDDHTYYFNEDEFKQFESDTDGRFGGIGAILALHPELKRLMVEAPMVGTPAAEAGLRPGDLILRVGETSTQGLSVDDARMLIKGEPGTTVELTIRHEGLETDEVVKLTRANIRMPVVRGFARRDDDPAKWEWLADKEAKIAIIRLSAFNRDTHLEVKAAVQEAEKEGAKALVFDLRGNGGGVLEQAVLISDLFLNDGLIVSTRDRVGGGREWKAKKGDTLFEPASERPMAVLIDRNSASASEIVAAALQENGRAAVVGERSYGKGSVQKVLPLRNAKTALKVTTEMWQTPNGRNLDRKATMTDSDPWGIKPDESLEVPLTPEQRKQYLKHISRLDVRRPITDKPLEKFDDPVLGKAMEHLRKMLAEPAASKPS